MPEFDFTFEDLQTNLHVEQLDQYLFRASSLDMGLTRVFGGQVLAQSLNAAYRSAPQTMRPHSLHGYFLRPGDTTRQIIYEVDPIRNGRSFSTRRVVAKQNGEAIFNSSISFHKIEDGLNHQMDKPDNIAEPESLPSDAARLQDFQEKNGGSSKRFTFPNKVIDIRSPYPLPFEWTEPMTPEQGFWFRYKGPIKKDDPVTHMTLLAFISDKRLMSTGLMPHTIDRKNKTIMGASLDHALWFHTDINLDDWIYYHMDSPRSARARDFSRGSFYDQSGELIASSAQEGLIRVIDKPE